MKQVNSSAVYFLFLTTATVSLYSNAALYNVLPTPLTQTKVSQVLAFSTVTAKECNEAKNSHLVVRRDTGYQSALLSQWCTSES